MNADEINDALANALFALEHDGSLVNASVPTIAKYVESAKRVEAALRRQGIVITHEQTFLSRIVSNVTTTIKAAASTW